MRRFYRKGLGDSEIEAAMEALASDSVRELKLFYIISGLEGEQDLAEFSAFAHAAAERRRSRSRGQRILVSAGYLARLPFTPLQYAPLCLDRERLEGIADRTRLACEAAGLEFRLASDFEDYYVDQVLSLGGRALGPWLEACAREGRAYDSSLSRGAARSLEAFAASAGLLGLEFLGEKDEAWLPPLAFVDRDEKGLRRAYESPSSFAPDRDAFRTPPLPDGAWLPKLERLSAAKRGFAELPVRLSLPDSLALACPEYRSSWVMRSLLAARGGPRADAAASIFEARDAFFSKGGRLEGMADAYCGLSYYYILGPDPSRLARAAQAAGWEVLEELPRPERIRAELSLDAGYSGEAEASFRDWLAESRVETVETRGAASALGRARVFRCSRAAEKKRLLFEATLVASAPDMGDRFLARLELGPKARLESWVERLSAAARGATILRFTDYY